MTDNLRKSNLLCCCNCLGHQDKSVDNPKTKLLKVTAKELDYNEPVDQNPTVPNHGNGKSPEKKNDNIFKKAKRSVKKKDKEIKKKEIVSEDQVELQVIENAQSTKTTTESQDLETEAHRQNDVMGIVANTFLSLSKREEDLKSVEIKSEELQNKSRNFRTLSQKLKEKQRAKASRRSVMW